MRVKKYYQDAGILTTKGVMKSRINADELFPIITDGEGTKFLADNGEYLEVTSGGASVELSDATNSTSTTVAASSKAVKAAYDKATSADTKATTATTTATGAKTTADTAISTADASAVTAGEAKTLATTAKTTADTTKATVDKIVKAEQYAPTAEVELNCTWGTKKIYRQRFTGTVNADAVPVSTVIKAELGAKLIVAIYGGRTDTVIPAGAISDNGELLTIKMVGTDLTAVATTGSAGTAESFTYDISIDYTKT